MRPGYAPTPVKPASVSQTGRWMQVGDHNPRAQVPVLHTKECATSSRHLPTIGSRQPTKHHRGQVVGRGGCADRAVNPMQAPTRGRGILRIMSFPLFVFALILVSAGNAQTILRMAAGEARSLPGAYVRLAAIRSATIDPPLAHPFRFEQDGASLRVIVPPATPPGVYRVALEGEEFTVS